MGTVILVSSLASIIVTLLLVLLLTPVYRKKVVEYSSPYCLEVENTLSEKANAILYGNNEYLLAKNFGSDIGVEVKSKGYTSYVHSILQSGNMPFEIRTIRIKSTIGQLRDMVINLHITDANGQKFTNPIIVSLYLPNEMVCTTIDSEIKREIHLDIHHHIRIDGNTHLEIAMNPNSKANFYIFRTETKYVKTNILMAFFKNPKKGLSLIGKKQIHLKDLQ
jgi:hypothetical protein